MKRFLSLLLSVLMLFSFATSVIAVDENSVSETTNETTTEPSNGTENNGNESNNEGADTGEETECQHTYEPVVETDTEGNPVNDSTCSEQGTTLKGICTKCNAETTYSEPQQLPLKAHVEVIDAEVPATCTETGLTAGKHCSVCNTVLETQKETSAKGHTYEIFEKTDATCKVAGKITSVKCKDCDSKITVDIEIPVAQHTIEVIEGKPATCTETGLTKGAKCSVCNDIFVKQEEIPALGHKEVIDAEVPATCTGTGLTAGKHCSVCDTVLEPQTEIPALRHTSVVDEAVAPTCVRPGLTEGSHCELCGETIVAQEETPATGHSKADEEPDVKVVAPTCEDNGYRIIMCSADGCNELFVVETSAIGHTSVDDAEVKPTCTETGLSAGKHCSVCNEVLEAQTVIPASGHTSVDDAEVKPTCTETGLTAGEHCSVCNEVLESQIEISALGHTWIETATEVKPTCTEKGKTAAQKCSVCGEVEAAKEIPALGHKVVKDAAKAPTCTATGLTEGSHCSVCEKVIKKQENVPAKGHAWSSTVTKKATYKANGNLKYTCKSCKSVKNSPIYLLKSVTLSTTDYTYNGKVKKPGVTVKDSKGKTVSSSFYTVTYSSGRKNSGRYSVKVTFKGRYEGAFVRYFNIRPSKATIKSVTSGKKYAIVNWAKPSTYNADYVLVEYSTNSKFTNSKGLVYKASSGSGKVTGLSSKKRYYFRVTYLKKTKIDGKVTYMKSKYASSYKYTTIK